MVLVLVNSWSLSGIIDAGFLLDFIVYTLRPTGLLANMRADESFLVYKPLASERHVVIGPYALSEKLYKRKYY